MSQGHWVTKPSKARNPGELSSCMRRAGPCPLGWAPPWWASEGMPLTLSAVEPRPARSTFAFPIVGAAEGPVVAVARVDAVGTPMHRWASWKHSMHGELCESPEASTPKRGSHPPYTAPRVWQVSSEHRDWERPCSTSVSIPMVMLMATAAIMTDMVFVHRLQGEVGRINIIPNLQI